MSPAALKLVAGGIAAALAAGLGILPQPAGARDADPLEAARRAAEQLWFSGEVEVFWHDATGEHRETLTVEDAGGLLFVRGKTSIIASPGHRRMVARGTDWDLLWSGGLNVSNRPDAAGKYQMVPAGTATVVGRITDVFAIREQGTLREQVYLDRQTGLLLRRERFGAGGSLEKTVAFKTLTFGVSPGQPPTLPAAADEQELPQVVPIASLTAKSTSPQLADGYRLVAAYRHDDVVHLLYSDGLYDLSVFQQQGRLEKSGLPRGGQGVKVARATAWSYPWPGGHMIVWEAEPAVFTMVSDAPLDQLLQAASGLRGVESPQPSLLSRLRHAARTLVGPLAE